MVCYAILGASAVHTFRPVSQEPAADRDVYLYEK